MSAPAARLARSLPVALALCVAAVAPPPAAAQVWVPLDGSPPGTPAEILFDENASTPTEFFFDIRVHGFWTEDVAPGDGNVYQRLRVPGLSHLGQLGAPDLPVARLRLAVSTPPPVVTLVSVLDLDPNVFAGQLVYPWTIEETDEAFDPGADPGPGDPDGTPEQFTIDPGIYAGPPFPAGDGTPFAPVRDLLGPIPGAIPEIHAAQWDPGTGLLSISGHLRVHLSATGAPFPRPPMTRDRAALAAATFHNWPAQQSFFPTDLSSYAGRYLIVTPEDWVVPLMPFARFRKARGLAVEFLTLESLPSKSCADIRAGIDAWYQLGNPWADAYVLLVGDSNTLPQCAAPTAPTYRTDDLYGSPADGDLDEELFVGRLSVDGLDDLQAQVHKLMTYVTDDTGAHYDRAVLVAHGDGAPAGYVGVHDAVAGAAYATPPQFLRIDGDDPAVAAEDVTDQAQDGFGVLAYRGHGTQASWPAWNTTADDFHKNELLPLTNTSRLGVLWSVSCWNSAISYGPGLVDTLGETWMEQPGSGVVAHYGATDAGGRLQNDEVSRRLFEGVFDLGLLRHGQALAWAESRMTDTVPGDNAWMGMLLGDPAMVLRREDARPIVLDHPAEVPVCPSGSPCVPIVVRVTDGAGSPVPDALVTLYKAGPPGEPDDFLVTGYTDENGSVQFDVGPSDLSNGIDVTGNDPCGNDSLGSIGVVDGVWANLGAAHPGVNDNPGLAAEGPLTPASQLELGLSQANESAVAVLFVSLASDPVAFKGGTLVAHPWLLTLDRVTSVTGEDLIVAAWPNGVPSDTPFWFQYAIADPAASHGVALSNAMRGTTP